MSELKQKLIKYKSEHPEATYRQMQKLFNVSSPSVVHYHLNAELSKQKVKEKAARIRLKAAKCDELAAELTRTEKMLAVAEEVLKDMQLLETEGEVNFEENNYYAGEGDAYIKVSKIAAEALAEINKMKEEKNA